VLSRPFLPAALVAVLAAVTFAVASASGAASPPSLKPGGIGAVDFGLPKSQAVAELSRLFGQPSATGINTACGRRYSEVVWGDLAAEFRGSVFSGYRYINGGYPLVTPGSPRQVKPSRVTPRLATSREITLGSTLAGARVAYGTPQRIGADVWRAGGLSFTDNATHDPVPPSSRIVEIKTGTCGDF
jgi:hypothetical protein